jgi:thiosulfate/3-mercaptopyruvate sulfurtransferase
MENLVSTEWLAAELGKPDLMVFDTTKYLPNEPHDGKAKFAEAHVPGADYFDIDLVADPDSALPHMIPTAARFEKLMGLFGVSNASRIVFYDQKGLASAARGWWLMRLFGHAQAAVLDGGLPKWVKEGRRTEAGPPPPRDSAEFTADFQAELVRGIGDVKRIVRQGGGGALILDARAKGRFDGTAAEPRPGLPSGHMPGAANLPFTELLKPDQTLLDPAALRERFSAAGVTAERPVVTTCGTGVTACILSLGLMQAGFPEPAVYDGSWTEWAGRPETPKVHA